MKKSLNRYQINLYVYKERLAKCADRNKYNGVIKRIKRKIHLFERMIKKKKEINKRLSEIDDLFTEYFELNIAIRDILMMNTHSKPDMLKIKSLYFYKIYKESIMPGDVRLYYSLPITKDNFISVKTKATARVKQKYMDDWNQLRMYIKLKNEVESNA